MKKRKQTIRYSILGVLLLLVWLTQSLPAMGEAYARSVYPPLSFCLSSFSRLIPFALGDLFIFLSIVGVIAYPFYARIRKKHSWKTILLRDGEYLLWIYVWFYLAWGLNYSQPNFYQRTNIAYSSYDPQNLREFVAEYIDSLNHSYTPVNSINEELVCRETVRLYNEVADSLGVHRPPHESPRVKTMLFTPFISMVGVTGSMGPFFCEFTLNGDLLPVNYPATYAHELAHLLGITSEAEANFYAYQVCTRSTAMGIRFSGYFSVLNHVLRNAQRLLPEEDYIKLVRRIRPEIIELAQKNQAYWSAKYSPLIGAAQDWIYDLYLKGNKIESGRQNYSEVVGLLLSYRESKKGIVSPDLK
ncbi:DUF3810 domain-containing protein [Bacteroides reticulotermitis]|uniref:DUF3810 domain-containing protein n=1 Tax=Bacteroides reticulotermitis TaxID=1133319 RepID=UPI003A83FE77